MKRCKKCCIKHCDEENLECKCQDHMKVLKEMRQKTGEELAEAGLHVEDVDKYGAA